VRRPRRSKPVIRFELHRREEGDWLWSQKRSVGTTPNGDHIFRLETFGWAPTFRAAVSQLRGRLCRGSVKGA
jgi:hypothetical protein